MVRAAPSCPWRAFAGSQPRCRRRGLRAQHAAKDLARRRLGHLLDDLEAATQLLWPAPRRRPSWPAVQDAREHAVIECGTTAAGAGPVRGRTLCGATRPSRNAMMSLRISGVSAMLGLSTTNARGTWPPDPATLLGAHGRGCGQHAALGSATGRTPSALPHLAGVVVRNRDDGHVLHRRVRQQQGLQLGCRGRRQRGVCNGRADGFKISAVAAGPSDGRGSPHLGRLAGPCT